MQHVLQRQYEACVGYTENYVMFINRTDPVCIKCLHIFLSGFWMVIFSLPTIYEGYTLSLHMKMYYVWPKKQKKGKLNETRSGFVHQSGSSGLVGRFVLYILHLTPKQNPHFFVPYTSIATVYSGFCFFFAFIGVAPFIHMLSLDNIIGYHLQLGKFVPHIIMINFLFLL